MYKFIELPLAPHATEAEQQLIRKALDTNPGMLDAIKTFSNYAEWPEDVCYICGFNPDSCNCDGHYNESISH